MNDYELAVLSDFRVHCPKYIIQKYKHKHANASDWTRFYYYKAKQKILVAPENLDYDYEVSSTLAYNKNVFYKMTTMSNSDTFFDYYFKLKSELPKVVVKSSNRRSLRHLNLKYKEREQEREFTKDGKLIVRFL